MRNASILTRIGGLAIAITLAVQAISVTVVLLTPPPAIERMSPALVLAAVRDAQVADAVGWSRTTAKEAPFETSTGTGSLVAIAMARALGLPSSDLRVRMIAQAQPGKTAGAMTSIVSTGQAGSRSVAEMRALGAAQADRMASSILMAPGFSLSAFQTAVLQPDGSWLIVEPPNGAFLQWLARLSLTFALSLLIIAPLVWWAARRLTLPVRALASAARRSEFTGLSEDREIRGPPEVVAVAEALEDMRRILTTQVEQRMRIMAAVAHDLRTPLTSLRLRAETAPPTERDLMAMDITRMETMIADVLAFSEAGLARGQRRRIDVCAACCDVVADPVFKTHVILTPAPPTFIHVDPDRLRRIVSNLIDNAIRYGGAAEMWFEATTEDVIIVIADRGPGIEPNQFEKVFEPFFRLESSRNRSTGGAGLGLAICKELVALDAGNIEVKSRHGGGLEAQLSYRVCR